MPERTEYVWVTTYYDTAKMATDVLAVHKSEEGKDKFLLRLMRNQGKIYGKSLNLNQVNSTLVQVMQ